MHLPLADLFVNCSRCNLPRINYLISAPINLSYFHNPEMIRLNYIITFYSNSSVDLVERLVGDILSTTESYKQLQERESRISSDFNLAQAQLFPLRKENIRLNRENHQLHVESISQKEHLDLSLEDQKREIDALNDKLNEIKYLNVAREKEIKLMEKERDRMKEVNIFFLNFTKLYMYMI